MAVERFFKIIKPKSPNADLTNNQDISGSGGAYGNYTWYNRLTQGSAHRIAKYREYDIMDEDIAVSRALEIITEEMTGNNPKTNMPLELHITSGNEQRVEPTTVVTLKAALNTWCIIQDWHTRLHAIVKSVLKYGDAFFSRQKKNKKWLFIHAKNVSGAIVAVNDITEVRGWHIKIDNKEINKGHVSSGYLNLNSNLYEQGVEQFKADDIIRFSLCDDTSEEAPFGISILRNIYKTFRQKELLEDALIIYRISRAPERRVFYIDTGGAPSHKVSTHLEQIKNEIKQRKIPTQQGGKSQIDSIYNPLSINEDYFFSVNGTRSSSTRVETLPGGQSQSTEELEYFYQELWKGLRIPASYVGNTIDTGQPFNDGAVGIAYIQEIKFSQYVERLQKFIDAIMDKEFKRFLMDNGIKHDPTVFRVQLPPPTNWSRSKQQKIDNDASGTYNSIKDDPTISKRFGKIHYLQWTQEQLLINERMLREELGIDPDGGVQDLPRIYAPDVADQEGYSGSVNGGSGSIGEDISIDEETDEISDSNNTQTTDLSNSNQNSQ